MMHTRKLFVAILLLTAFANGYGQYQSVQFDFEKNWFGENQLLPSETDWMLTGPLPLEISLIEVEIHGDISATGVPNHVAVWHQLRDVRKPTFSIPINYKLRGNSAYTMVLKFYKPAPKEEVADLRRMLTKVTEAYLDLNVNATRNNINLGKNPKMMVRDLDKIVQDGMSLYRNALGVPFPGFSQLVEDQLRNMDNVKLRHGKFTLGPKEDDQEASQKVVFFQQQLQNLKLIVEQEITQYLNYDYYVLSLSRAIPNYRTERTRRVIPLNVGYGVVYENSAGNDFRYDAAPYVGVSLPLANAKFSSKFWSNSAISIGVFLQDFEIDETLTYTGPFINKPFYLAYGYKVAYFLRLNAGATALEEIGGTQNIYVRPFIGATIEINMWLGLSK